MWEDSPAAKATHDALQAAFNLPVKSESYVKHGY